MEPSPSMTCRLAGRTAMSLTDINGVPARMSMSWSSTTNPSNSKVCVSRVKNSRASPTTFIGEEPSAWWAVWELVVTLARNRRMAERRKRLHVAPLSIIMRA